MVRATKQYGRWLRDNFADLEHKEVWQSHVVMAVILLVFGTYAFTSEGPVYQYAMQVIIAMLICHLLWRVETLSCLTPATSSKEEERGEEGGLKVEGGGRIEGGEARNIIGPLLKQ